MEVIFVNDDSNYYSEEDSRTSPTNDFENCTSLITTHSDVSMILVLDPLEDKCRFDDEGNSCLILKSSSPSTTDRKVIRNDLLQLDACNIQYRGEGNSSLVLALKQEGKVIRILKKGNIENNELLTKLSTQDRLTDVIDFQENVMKRIMNNDFLNVPRMIFLNESQVSLINDMISLSCRPHHRLSKSIPSGTSTFALLMPDYCCLPDKLRRRFLLRGPVVSVEIKPKQGFLPSPESLPEEMLIKSKVSRFCLKQFHKMKRGRIAHLSKYCPLDLFSGCHSRQRKSLASLLETPQNNLRIFKDLQLMFGDDHKDRDQLYTVLRETLVSEENHEESETDNKSVVSDSLLQESFVNILLKALNRSSRVGNSRQQDIESNLIPVEQSFCQLHQESGNGCPPDSCQQSHYLDGLSVLGSVYSAQRLDSVDSYRALEMARFLHRQNPNLMNDLRNKRLPFIGSPHRLPHESLEEFYFRKVWEYIVSLTAKDCSIMITMQRIERIREPMNDSEEGEDEEDYDVIETASEVDMDLDSASSSSSENESRSQRRVRKDTVIEVNPRVQSGHLQDLEYDFNVVRDEVTGNTFAVSVAITDLDPKLPSKYPKLEKKIREKDSLMIASYNEFLSQDNNNKSMKE